MMTNTKHISFFRFFSLKNLVQKFNAKLGGINQIVSLARILTATSTDKDIFMFFGIDCTSITCSKERPSIAAIVGSKDSTSFISPCSSLRHDDHPLLFQVHSI